MRFNQFDQREELDECALDKDRRQREDDEMKSDEASAPEGLDLGRFLFDQANLMNQQRALGLEHGHLHAALDMKTLFTAYDKAVLDPNTKIPTMLHIAIESLRKKYAP